MPSQLHKKLAFEINLMKNKFFQKLKFCYTNIELNIY